MGIGKFLVHLFGWLLTIIFQVVASYLVIFILSIIFSGVDTTSHPGWLASLLVIWIGFIIGISLIGLIAIGWIWKGVPMLTRNRLVGTIIGALIPLLILLPVGYSVPVGDIGTRFYDLVTDKWQPILAQASLFTGILGFYIPGIIKSARGSALKS